MNHHLHEVDIKTFQGDVFQMFGGATPLLTAGNKASFNTMTIGWGGLGTLWNKPVCTVYVRPERYTYEFTEQNEYYTVSVFSEEYKDTMKRCGSTSGRDTDKVKDCGLTPAFADHDAPYFEEADLVLVCRKMYAQDMKADCVLDADTIGPFYGAKGNWHRMYVGEVVQILKK